jgi:small-conductance mechanosensitive channel
MVVPVLIQRVAVRVNRRLPNGWRDAVAQLLLFVLADFLYECVRGLVTGHTGLALFHAEQIVSLERSTHTFVEPAMQGWLLPSHAAIQAANWAYANIHFTLNLVFLGWLYVYRHHAYAFVRNCYFVGMGIALAVHLAVPVAPPRLLPAYGFVDTIKQIAHVNQDSGAIGFMVNPYAAVPSMHVCFAVIASVTGVMICRRLWARALWAIYPFFVTFVVVVTANHFVFDAVAGVATALVAAVVAQWVMARARPHAWAWRAQGAEVARI